ncbi:MAG TPA: hypothetical protein VM186_11300 [Planctomycetota bacterium]|nr:hypothetical protein [Planctomycetota bacterium]
MTEFLERLNKPKAVFVLALLMMAGVGYAVIRHELKEQRLPGQPTIKRVELQVADRDLSSKITPQRVSRYWGFGPRNFFQPPRPNIKVTGYFSVSASAESKIDLVRVSGNYMCVPDAPVGQIEIQFPAAWLSHLTGMSDNVKSKMLGGTRREMQITLKEVQKGEFRINLTLTMPLKGQTQIEFPEIIFKGAASEAGQITLMGTQSYDLKATTVEKLDPTASQGGAQAYRYTSHPYKLGLALTKKAVVAAPPKPKPPTNRPGPDDGKKPDEAKHPNVDQPPPEEPAFEVPFTFKGMVKIGKPTALLEGKEDKKLKRYTVGDTVDGLTITAIYATSVVVRDEKGNEYELQDALRQKYDYE